MSSGGGLIVPARGAWKSVFVMSAIFSRTACLIDSHTLNVALLYDDYSSGRRAKTFFDQITLRLGGELRFSLALWRLDALALPDAASAALRDFSCANSLVLALRPETPVPAPVLAWVESWAKTRLENDSALIVLRTTQAASQTPTASLAPLRELAENYGLNFFCEAVGEPAHDSQAFTDHLRQRAQAMTPTLRQIMDCYDRGGRRPAFAGI